MKEGSDEPVKYFLRKYNSRALETADVLEGAKEKIRFFKD